MHGSMWRREETSASRLRRAARAPLADPTKTDGSGGDFEAAGGAFDAGVNSDGFEQAGGDEAVALAVEVQQRERGLPATDPVLVAQSDDGVGESRALLGTVDLLVDVGECVPAPFGVVVLDRFAQTLEVGADQPWQLDQQREIDRGEIHDLLGEVLECTVREPVELVDRLIGELGDMRAGELFLGGAAVLAATALGLAA
jgi:hypothetical protein